MKINELFKKINSNEITVIDAVNIVEAENMTYAIKYFSPQTDEEMPYWDMLAEWERRQELKQQYKQQPKQNVSTVPIKSGQLWEPCRCGVEPVYMPLNLCDKCWPTEGIS